MKLFVGTALVAALFVSVPALAGENGHAMGHEHVAAGASQSAKAVGVVKGVDAAKGKASISHEAIPSLNWPPMVMNFKMTPEMLSSVKVGQRIEFEFEMQGRDAVVTKVVSAQ